VPRVSCLIRAVGGEITAKIAPGLAAVDNIDLRNASVPEPATMLLLASALAVGAAVRRRK
jgi:PEP-CTERM motif